MTTRYDSRSLAVRLAAIRADLFGEDGLAELARRLNVPARTWANYERGVTIPGTLLLEFLVLTGVSPEWLLRGEGAMYRSRPPDVGPASGSGVQVGAER